MFRIKSSGQVKSQGEIRKLHPNVSLPRVWDASICEYLGIDPVLAAPAPEVTDLQIAVQSGVKQDAKGNWVTDWDVRNKFNDYEKENEDGTKTTVTRAEQEAAYLAKKIVEKEASVRAERDKKLAETDWMALSDVTMSDAWAVYRQALRDITSQDGFPDSVTWPTKPE